MSKCEYEPQNPHMVELTTLGDALMTTQAQFFRVCYAGMGMQLVYLILTLLFMGAPSIDLSLKWAYAVTAIASLASLDAFASKLLSNARVLVKQYRVVSKVVDRESKTTFSELAHAKESAAPMIVMSLLRLISFVGWIVILIMI
ncbi:MAG: hypothetical protein VXY77_00190 [Pseudomonadota bacterium]|nr:hypothetical protein [Pseudomonadota bacterium]